MAQDKVEKILNLCESWKNAAYQDDGGLGIGEATEKYRLLSNDIKFHELNYKEMQAACIGLTRVLLHKGLNAIVDFDHLFFWSWSAEVLLHSDLKYFSEDEREIRELFKTTIRSTLAGVNPPVSNKEEWEKQRKKDEFVEFNTEQLIMKKSLITAYLVFPLLEAVLKKTCKKYVDYSGKARTDFSVPNGYGGSRTYGTSGRTYCSSLRDLLFLLYNNVANDNLKEKLTFIREHISELSGEKDPFSLIYDWRNSSLHGETNFPTIGGTLLNLVILIALNEIKDIYNQFREKVLEKVQWEMQSYKLAGHRPHWSFYPPF